MGKNPQDSWKHLLQVCREMGIPWQFVPDLEDLGLPNLQTHVVGGLPLVTATGSAFTGLNLRIKQLIDLVPGAVLLALTVPVWVWFDF